MGDPERPAPCFQALLHRACGGCSSDLGRQGLHVSVVIAPTTTDSPVKRSLLQMRILLSFEENLLLLQMVIIITVIVTIVISLKTTDVVQLSDVLGEGCRRNQ